MPDVPPAPGRFRYAIVALLFLVTSLNYADRAILAITAPVLTKDLGIDALALGWVFSAFGWACRWNRCGVETEAEL